MIQGRTAEAKAIYAEALRLGRQDDPGGYWERVPLHALVFVEAASSNFRAAADYARQGYELYRKYSGDENPYTAQSKDTLGTLSCRSWSVGRGGCRGRARCHVGGAQRFTRGSRWISSAVWERSARIQFGEASPGGGIVCACGAGDERRATLFRQLGEALSGQQRYQEAIVAFEQAEGIYRQNSTPTAKDGLQQVQTTLRELRAQTKK